MADITMCKGSPGVTKCLSCYRHTATPCPYRQSMFVVAPMKPDGTCPEYWANIKGE